MLEIFKGTVRQVPQIKDCQLCPVPKFQFLQNGAEIIPDRAFT